MAGKKATTPVQEDPKQEIPVQETEVEETPQENVEQETPVQEDPKQEEKVYKFKSENPYLTVADLGIQFREGKAQTTNLNVARALAKVGGVELVEE